MDKLINDTENIIDDLKNNIFYINKSLNEDHSMDVHDIYKDLLNLHERILKNKEDLLLELNVWNIVKDKIHEYTLMGDAKYLSMEVVLDSFDEFDLIKKSVNKGK